MLCNSKKSPQKPRQHYSPPVWRGPPPIRNVFEKYREVYSFECFADQPRLKFDDDMLTQNDGGCVEILMGLGGAFLMLHEKHREELAEGYRNSFFNELDYPALLKDQNPFCTSEAVNKLLKAQSLDEAKEAVNDLPARLIFEAILEFLARLDDFKQTLKDDQAAFLKGYDMSHLFRWDMSCMKTNGDECDFITLIRDSQLELNMSQERVANLMAADWFVNLQESTNQESIDNWKFVIVNLTQMVREYFEAAAENTPAKDAKSVVIEYSKMYEEAVRPLWQALGAKFGKYMIKVCKETVRNLYSDKTMQQVAKHILPVKSMYNTVLADRQQAFCNNAEPKDFITHDKNGCNFDNPLCACAIVVNKYPHLFKEGEEEEGQNDEC